MSNSDHNGGSDNADLTDLSSSTSGELYEPSAEFYSDDSRVNLFRAEETLTRVNTTLVSIDSTLEETTYFLRSTDRRNKRRATTIMMEKENQQERYMTVEQALKIIPIFNGESMNDNHAFQNSCEFALQNIDPRQTENFVRGITTRLVGKAYRPFRYKKVTSYQEIKSALDAVVSKRSTLAHLHSKLSMLRMMVGESIQQYSDRAEQLFYDILEESVTTGGLTDIDGITRITSKQVLTAFMEGLPHDTRIIVKAARPDDLEEAVQYALEEETTRASQLELRRGNSD